MTGRRKAASGAGFCSKALYGIAILWSTTLLAACATTPAKPEGPKTVNVAVAVSCISDKLPERKALPFTLSQILAADGPNRYRMVTANLSMAMQRLDELEPAVVACR